MKKMIALLIAALLALSAAAFAETYRSDDLTFVYDENAFEIARAEERDDETEVALNGKNEAWGPTYINFYLKDVHDGEKIPTADELAKANSAEVTQGEWNGYRNVLMYTVEEGDGITRSCFVVPIMDDDDDEVEDLLTVQIGVSQIDDEAVLMGRDDAISAILDSLKVDD